MKWEVRLLTGNYERENDEITVKLFGRTKNGKSPIFIQNMVKDRGIKGV